MTSNFSLQENKNSFIMDKTVEDYDLMVFTMKNASRQYLKFLLINFQAVSFIMKETVEDYHVF